ncbi:MAG: polysaccharide deacetylase family protein [Caulobacteraceae bacterium]
MLAPLTERAPGVAPGADRLIDKLRRRAVRFAARKPAGAHVTAPTVSFSFDDVPLSAVETGAAILEAAGARGTFYVTGGLSGQDSPMGTYAGAEALKALAARGHEIGCHSFSHLDCSRADEARIAADFDQNAEYLETLGQSAVTFAYPYGEVSLAAKRICGQRFAAARTVRPGLIRGGFDLNHLPSPGIEGPDGEARSAAWIERAVSERAWLILYTHDVRENPSQWGCTPDTLERLVKQAKDRGCAILTVKDALHQITTKSTH